ncbi:hypothetical protein KR044_004243, partial [Drosophila immigrans]
GDDGSGNDREYDTDTSNYTYSGSGGVDVSNIFNRAMYAAKFQSMNLMLSDVIGSDSKILYDRDPRERVHKVAPDELNAHLRYPEDMFKVQRELIARYHVDDPGVFFTNDAFWSVPSDPTAPEGRQELAQPPYHVVA